MTISIGLKTNTHLFICTQSILSESIIKVKEDADFTTVVDSTFLTVVGGQGDAFRLSSLTTELSKIYSLKYKTQITPSLVANTLQKESYEQLRRGGYKCSAIVGGLGSGNLELYCIDPYGALYQDNFVVTGYGLYFLYGLFDSYYSEDMGREEAVHFLRLCIKALRDRMVLDTSKWIVNEITRGGEKARANLELE